MSTPDVLNMHHRHSWGQHPSCPGCVANRVSDDAEAKKDRDAEIDRFTCDFITQANEALAVVAALVETVTLMAGPEVYDTEMAESAEGGDALHELERAARSLRHVQRIARWRRDLELKNAGIEPEPPAAVSEARDA